MPPENGLYLLLGSRLQKYMYVQNKWPNSALGFKTPEEIYTDIKPSAAYLIYFGFKALAYILSDKRTKLDDVSFK